jgi:hypothetical protein
MAATDLPTPKTSVVFKEMEDGAVLYCTESEVYFGLNPVGVRIWHVLEEGAADLPRLVQEVREAYPDAPSDEVSDDVREFLRALVESDLVSERDPTP